MAFRTNWLRTRQTKFTAYATLYILVVLAAVVLANWLANRHNRSIDTTANKRFSLSDQTEKVVRGLKQDVKLTYWDRSSEFDRARDVLGRYDALSPKLSVQYVDPTRKPQLARQSGVRETGLVVIEGAGRRQEARSLNEEEITGALIRALKGGERNVCFVAGSGEPTIGDTGREGFSMLKTLMEREQYKTREISLLQKAEVPKDCTVTIAARPRFDYVDPVVNALKTYVDNAGRLLVMLSAPLRSGNEPAPEQAALLKILEGWGVKANKDLILEPSAVGQLAGLGPEVPLITSYESHAIVREMSGAATAFPLPRSLEVSGSASKVISTTDNSFAVTDLGAREVRVDPRTAKKGPFTIAAAAEVKGSPGQGRVVVYGSTDWATNVLLRFNGNPSLAMNTLNWLSSDEDLISIRPKEPEDRRLNLSRRQMQLLQYTSLLLLPLAAVVVGVAVWWKRR
ncbi:MAG TPA: GldG family protein [Bryobacteraceae bacterium]|nr:GldG family protein [Bryobacteraceae bacterium]